MEKEDKRIIAHHEQTEDVSLVRIRPSGFDEFVGQKNAKENLTIFIDSATKRKDVLDHVLLHGPPGLGKTTLAQIIAKELGVNFRSTAGPLLSKSGDLASILTNLEMHDVLFIDEIHRLNTAVEEVLYSAMEDFCLDLIIGEGPGARSVKIDLPPFTLIGATTRIGLLSNPLRDRFGIPTRLEFYSMEELKSIITRAASVLSIEIEDEAAHEIAKRSRGTPRITIRLLKRVRDFAEVTHTNRINKALAVDALNKLEVDQKGLDRSDKRYLYFMAEYYKTRPVGIETIAAALSEKRDTLEETIEPYLLQIGFLERTPRGRVLTPRALDYLGLDTHQTALKQSTLFPHSS